MKVAWGSLLKVFRMPGSTRTMQGVLLALCLIGLFAVGESAWASYALYGDIFGGSPYGPVTVAPFFDRFESIVPGSLAERSGIRAGDAVDLRAMTPATRYSLRNEWLMGRPVTLPIVRNGVVRSIVVTPGPYTLTAFWKTWQAPFAWAFWLGSAFSLLVAAILIWRRPESVEVRTLALTLILIQIGENFFPINGWLTKWVELDVVLNIIAQFVFMAGIALLARYALLFGRPISRLRRALTGLTYVLAALSAVIWTGAAQGGYGPGGAIGIAGLWFGTLDLRAWFVAHPLQQFIAVVVPPAMALLCAAFAVRDSVGAERSRVAWATGSLAVLYLFGIATVQSYFSSNVIAYYWLLNAAWFVTPLGLLYALLSRRLLDVGFVLNRAAVFTAVSLLVVGVFTLVEWALGGWLHTAGRVANIAVSAAIALALGLSLHQIHRRVDRVVDNVFFRKRHEDEYSLRRFAREAAFITDSRIVLERATETLLRHTGASLVEFALHDGSRCYGRVDENDPAVVALRASHETVDLHRVETGLPGEFAYPMLARGRLVGALVLGTKGNGESYAPDESAAVAEVALSVGVALDLLGANDGAKAEPLLDALMTLTALARSTNEAVEYLRRFQEPANVKDVTE